MIIRFVQHVAPNRKRPTISLIVMLILGALWCGFWSLVQGEGHEPEYGSAWRPPDKGWFAGWIAYWALTTAVLVFLWCKRPRAWIIVITPIASTVTTIALRVLGLGPEPFPDQDDYTATFIDGFWRMFSWAVIAAVIASVIGLLALRAQSDRQSEDDRAQVL